MTVILSCLPDVGPGALKKRDVNPSATKKVRYMYVNVRACTYTNFV